MALIAATALFLAFAPDAQAQVPCVPGSPGAPSNDCFAAAAIVGANTYAVSQSAVGATMEGGEATPGYVVGASVWFRWTPTTSGTATVHTCGPPASNYNTAIGVYTGTAVNSLVLLAQNDNSCGLQSRVSFPCTAGTTYQIQVSASGTNAPGDLELHMECTTPCGYVLSPVAAYNFTDISTTGTVLGHGLDSQINVAIPWTAYYCGAYSSTLRTSSNGYICFSSSTPCTSYVPHAALPNSAQPNGAVYAYWTDLYVSACNAINPATNCGTRWQVTGSAPDRVFIYHFKNVPFYATTCTSWCAQGSNTFQMKLFEATHCWEIHYQSVTGQSTQRTVAGMEDMAGTAAMTWQNTPAPGFTAASQAWRLCPGTPPPPPPPVCSPVTQTRAAGQTATLTASGGAPPYSWSAPSSSNPSGSGTPFSTSYAAVGTYQVALTDSAGGQANCTVNVPPPSCSPLNQNRNVGQLATLTASWGAPPYSWEAIGSSNPAGTGAVFQTSYPAPGTNTVTLTDSAGMSANCTVKVLATACSPVTQTRAVDVTAFLLASGGTGSYSWSAPGATPATGTLSSFSPKYSAPGTHTVTLTSGSWSATCTVIVVPAACGYWTTHEANYDFIDISTTGGVPLNHAATSTIAVRPSPTFTFDLCGTTYDTFWTSSKGKVCFGSSAATYATSPAPAGCTLTSIAAIPSTATPNAAVYGFVGNLFPSSCPTTTGTDPNTGFTVTGKVCQWYQVQGSAPNRVFIYMQKDVPIASTCCYPGTVSYQIKLFESSNCIEVHYRDVNPKSSLVRAGFENPGGASGFAHPPPTGTFPTNTVRTETAWAACPKVPLMAVHDKYTFNEDQGPQALSVLANDHNIDANIAIVSHTQPSKGALTGPAAGVFTYVPMQDRTGADSFTYTIQNGTGHTATTTVRITINPVNDAPQFIPGPDVVTPPVAGPIVRAGWATVVRAGPESASDEMAQGVNFNVVSNDNPAIFSEPPTVVRSESATATEPAVPATSGAFGLLRYTLSGTSGAANVCLRAQDTGGTATVTNTWGAQAQGVNQGPLRCVNLVANWPPVAYFEATAKVALPGDTIGFDACPGPVPRCSHDPDGTIKEHRWEFGDGYRSQEVAPQHTYATPGIYRVLLTVIDQWGSLAQYVAEVEVRMPDAGSEAEEVPGQAERVRPIADAGESRTVLEGTFVVLGKEAAGGLRHEWTQVQGMVVDLAGADTAQPSFTAPMLPGAEPLELVFRVRVLDGYAASDPAMVAIRVVSANRAPVASAQAPEEVSAGLTVELDGWASLDPDGDELLFQWEQLEGPVVALAHADAAVATFVAPEGAGSLLFRLKVSDGRLHAYDLVRVDLSAASDLGPSVVVKTPQPVEWGVVGQPAEAKPPLVPVLVGALAVLAVAAVVARLTLRRLGK